jgi:hypothetical protein
MSKPVTYFRHTATGEIIASMHPETWATDSAWERLTARDGHAAHVEQSRRKLRDILKPGETVYTILRHVGKSGMSRKLDMVIVEDGRVRSISNLASTACGFRQDDNGAIKVGGCGFDAGFQCVYSLGMAMWPAGTPEPHGKRNGKPDSDGGVCTAP